MIYSTAFLKKRVIDEQTSVERYKLLPLKVWEVEWREEQYSPMTGVLAPRRRIVLKTESKVAAEIIGDDTIQWKGHDYSVEDVTGRPSARSANSRVYTITLL